VSKVTAPLVSVPAQNSATYTERTADISEFIGLNARLVILYQSGASFTGDIQLDDFNIGGNSFTDFSISQGFETNASSDNSKLSNTDDIQDDYEAVSWSTVGTSAVAGKFVRDDLGTPSGSTGLTSGNTGSFYLFAETSGDGSNNDFWLRSPEVTITSGTLSFFTAQFGATCGPIFAYLEITSDLPNTGWGRGTWSSLAWGEGDIDAVVPFTGWGRAGFGELGWDEGDVVVANASGQVGSATVFISASVNVTGLASSGQVAGVTITGASNVPITGLASSGQVAGVTITGASNVPITGLASSGQVGSVVVSATENVAVSVTGQNASGQVAGVTITGAANISLTGIAALNNFNPEYDLTLTGALPAGQISGTFTNRGQSIVFAGEVQLPSSFTQTECLWEHGGTGTGAFLGVSKILDTYYLRFRAGEGNPADQDNTPGDICLQNVAISSIPEFDGNTHTVVFELKPSAPSRIQLWIDGREVINTEKATAMEVVFGRVLMLVDGGLAFLE
jgi:hypothetical protein